MDVEKLIRVEEVAAWLDVPTSWVYAAARDGRLPCVRMGHHVRFRRGDIQAFVDAGGTSQEG